MIEALVAIVILTIGVLGPLSVATRGISDGLYAQNQLTAMYLAQEGIEAVRVVIENNIKESSSLNWLRGLDDCLGSFGCTVEIAEGIVSVINFSLCSSPGCTQAMAYTITGGGPGFYKLAPLGTHGFIRAVFVEPDGGSPSRAIVRSQITWQNKNISQHFELRVHLYDQY